MKVTSALGGLAGACALALLNEGTKKIDKHVPELNLLEMNSLARIVKGPKMLPLASKELFPDTIASDLITTSLYYGMANGAGKRDTFIRGTLLGLGAGIGALTLSNRNGEGAAQANRNVATKALTIALYVTSGLIAAAAINFLEGQMSRYRR
ncbi:MAG: hypothetical protein ACOYXT_04325 [Bacteroidota bacterium]